VFSQVSLVSIWAALGRTSTPWRLTGAFLIVAAWSIILSHTSVTCINFTSEWMVMLLIQAFAILGPMLVLRASGVCYARATEDSSATDREDGYHKRQFSIRYLFSWITATAIVLGVAQYCTGQGILHLDFIAWLGCIAFAATNVIIGCSSLWIALGTRWPIRRMILLAMSVLAILFGPVSFSGGFDESSISLSSVLGLELLLMLASLWVIRAAGYRVKRSSGAR